MIYNIDRALDNQSGVYIIKSTVTADSYIGKAVNLRKRYAIHICDIKRSHLRGITEYLKQYDASTLSMELLEACSPENMNVAEVKYINIIQPTLNKQSVPGKNRLAVNKIRTNTTIVKENSKKVSKYTLEGEYIETFESFSIAAKSLNKNAAMIKRVCEGSAISAYGYLWKYA